MKKLFWPGVILTIGLSFLAVTGWSIFRAATGASSVTDPDYYSHGLKYNSTSLEVKASQAQGWEITPRVDNDILTIKLTTKDKESIPNCSGKVIFLSLAGLKKQDSSAPPSADFTETSPGTYAAGLPTNLQLPAYATVRLAKNKTAIHRKILINERHE